MARICEHMCRVCWQPWRHLVTRCHAIHRGFRCDDCQRKYQNEQRRAKRNAATLQDVAQAKAALFKGW